jgi:hypothetical protein
MFDYVSWSADRLDTVTRMAMSADARFGPQEPVAVALAVAAHRGEAVHDGRLEKNERLPCALVCSS